MELCILNPQENNYTRGTGLGGQALERQPSSLRRDRGLQSPRGPTWPAPPQVRPQGEHSGVQVPKQIGEAAPEERAESRVQTTHSYRRAGAAGRVSQASRGLVRSHLHL